MSQCRCHLIVIIILTNLPSTGQNTYFDENAEHLFVIWFSRSNVLASMNEMTYGRQVPIQSLNSSEPCSISRDHIWFQSEDSLKEETHGCGEIQIAVDFIQLLLCHVIFTVYFFSGSKRYQNVFLCLLHECQGREEVLSSTF